MFFTEKRAYPFKGSKVQRFRVYLVLDQKSFNGTSREFLKD